MKDIKILAGLLVLVFSIISLAVAQPGLTRQAADVNPSGGHATVAIPGNAVEIAPGVFSLGTAVHNGKVVEGYAFIDYREGFSHKPQHTRGGGTTCYSFLAQGAKWKTTESWIMNPANTRGLDGTTLFSTQAAALAKWEDAADGTVGNSVAVNIFGDGTSTSDTLVADTSSPDGKNEVYFADVSNTGAIAVTIVWGIFSGPPFARELVEWDQVYDDVDFDWSLTGEAGKMDFDNIATHEDGHSGGMGHPPDECAEETMYRFAALGETKKRDLNTGDIAGIKKLYS